MRVEALYMPSRPGRRGAVVIDGRFHPCEEATIDSALDRFYTVNLRLGVTTVETRVRSLRWEKRPWGRVVRMTGSVG